MEDMFWVLEDWFWVAYDRFWEVDDMFWEMEDWFWEMEDWFWVVEDRVWEVEDWLDEVDEDSWHWDSCCWLEDVETVPLSSESSSASPTILMWSAWISSSLEVLACRDILFGTVRLYAPENVLICLTWLSNNYTWHLPSKISTLPCLLRAFLLWSGSTLKQKTFFMHMSDRP